MQTLAVGDIHGRFDLLEEALRIRDERFPESVMVFLGDYVDRGPQSAQVVSRLMELDPEFNVCLRGNHEQLMIEGGYLWHINGGGATVKSYEGNDQLMAEHREWMKNLPYVAEDSSPFNRLYVHAGINPHYPSDFNDYLWIRELFLRQPNLHRYVVHGHTHTWQGKVMQEVEDLPHRCNLDTCAYHTGILSMAVFDNSQLQPIEIIKVTL